MKLQKWFGAMMFGEVWSCIDWSAWWAEPDVASSVATKAAFTEDGFYKDFHKMLGYFCGDIVGLDGASELRSDWP